MSISLAQILALVGKLDDTPGDDTPRERFRAYLEQNVCEVGEIRDYIGECLLKSGEPYYRALQDLVNHIGHFLGFTVTFGRYQGSANHIGFDGHWVSPTGFHLVVEVKTTEIYAIKTKTLLGYVNELISEKKIPSWSSALGLYVVGKPDPDLQQLDNAITAEKHNDQLRIISVESLLALAEMASQFDIGHKDILSLLLPSGPRIDPVINLIVSLLGAQMVEPGTAHFLPAAGVPNVASGAAVAAPTAIPEAPTAIFEDKASFADNGTGPVYWLTPVKSDEEETAEECVQRLVGKEHLYAFGHRTPGRTHVKPGDWICFYATTKGIVGHARIASTPKNEPNPKVKHSDQFPWVFSVDAVKIYAEKPVVVDGALRNQLDAFKGRDLYASWAWFVQATHRVSQHDFGLLTIGFA